MTPTEKLQAIQEIRDPALKMNRILTDRAIAEAVLKLDFNTVIAKGEKGDKGDTVVGPMGPMGPQGIAGKDGIDGAIGPRGYAGITPVFGIDYWTNDHQIKMVTDVLSKIPTPKDGISPNVDDLIHKTVFELKKNPIEFKDIKGTEKLVEFLKLGGFRGGGGSGGSSFVSPLTTKGDIYTYTTQDARFPVGTNGQVLSSDSTQTTGLKWITLAGGGNMTTGTYDPAGIGEQLVGITASQTITNKDLSSGTNTFPTFNQNTTGSAAKLTTARNIAITGDLAWSVNFDGSGNVTAAGTLATVNSNVGSFASATQVGTFTVNGKGLITAAGNTTITPAASSITGGAALTKTNDTNVTLTLGGTPSTALLVATSLTLGWTGTLANTRGGTGQDSSASTGVAQVSSGTWSVSTALANGTTATTQTPADSSTKLATTAYVDAAVLGQNFKEAALVATTANLIGVYVSGVFTYTATGVNTIDGVSLALGNRVLVKNQTTTFQNGIYTVTTAGSLGIAGVLTRSTDANSSGEFKTGDSIFVSSGTANSNTTWAYTGIDSPTLGTDAITYAQTAGQGTVTSGNGITVTGLSVAIDTSVTVDKTTAQTLTNKTLTSPVFTSPTLGTPVSGNLSNCTNITPTSYTGLIEMIGLNDINSSIGNNTYTLVLYAEYGFTINELKIISGSGTCTAAVKINGTNVTSISAVSVSSSIATGTASGANTVSAGNVVTLVLSSTSSLTNLQATLKITRT